MKKNASNYLVGVVLVLIGILLAGRALDIFTFNIFFDGWWTLFIIVPCFIGLFNNNGDRTVNVIGLCIGIFLLLSMQDIIEWRMFGPLTLAAVLVVVGFRILMPKKSVKTDDINFNNSNMNQNQQNQNQQNNYQQNNYQQNDFQQNTYQNTNGQDDVSGANAYSYSYQGQAGSNPFEKNTNNSYQDYNQGARQGSGPVVCTAILSGRELHFDNEVFSGAMLSSVLGAIEIDLRNAIIRENVVIEAKAVLGGVNIFVPNYVRVVVNCTPILGGVDNKTITPMGADEKTITIYLNATCVLGGIDVK